MKIGPSIRLAALAIAVVLVAGCSATNKLTSSWSDPVAATTPHKKIVVVAATPNAALRRTFEDTFSNELRARGVDAVASYTFGGQGQMDKDQAIAKLKEMGADGVFVTRLVDKQHYETYYPPTYTTMAAPSAYYGGWYGYYSLGYSYMSSPGYVAENQLYKVETNLYDLTNDKLFYSGITETDLMAGDQPEGEVRPVIQILLKDMENKKVIPKKA